MILPLDDNDPQICYPPTPVLAEWYLDLDLQLLVAADEEERWAAVVAGTREVLDRFDHLASPQVRVLTGPQAVVVRLRKNAEKFIVAGRPDMAAWLQQVIDMLEAHADLENRCAEQIRNAESPTEAASAIGEAAASLRMAAHHMAKHRFPNFPPYRSDRPDFALIAAAGSCLADENHRTSLRVDLAGAGGAAGSAEFNPYVDGLLQLELATHRRLYRLFYDLCRHVGFDVAAESGLASPDDVDEQAL